jgi:hypothetical protein
LPFFESAERLIFQASHETQPEFLKPSGIADVQKDEIAEFSRLSWAIGLRKSGKVELR